MSVIVGTSADETLVGTNEADTISGNGGNDSLFGIEGNDVLDGGEGDDSLAGGAGSDTVNGGAGHDAIASHNGDAPDLIDGGADSDFLLLERNSYSGSLTLDLTTGGDFADIGDGTSIGNIESIQFQGGSGADHITASSGIFNELIYGNGGNDFLNSGGGNDTMDGGFGDDTLNGGAGDDQLASADGAAADVVDGGADTDLLLLYRDGYNGVLTLDLTNGGGGADIGDGTTVANIERVDFHGGSASDSIIGGALADTISGNGGNDSLFGIEGNDVLDGGEGDDSLAGGAGSDTVNGGAGHDAIASHNGDAPDLIDGGADSDFLLLERNSYSGSLTLDLTTGGDFADIGDGTSIGNIESIQFQGGSGADHITASSGIFNELIYGNGGNDFLNSGGGNDTMDGGFGDDTLNGGAGDDQLASADGAAADVVDGGADTDLLLLYRDGYNGVLTLDLTNGGGGADIGDGTTVANIERVDFHGGSASDSIIGGALADTISGNGGNDSLFGIEGNDVLDGGEGDDSLAGGAGSDTVNGGAGHDAIASHNGDAPDLIDGGADSDFLLLERNSYSGSLTLDLTTGGDFADIGDGTSIGNIESIQFQGGSGADHITASSGIFNELIYGNGGNDFLNSGGGNDTMDGGFGDDTLNGGAGDDQLASADGAAADVVDGGADTDLLLLYRDGYNGVLTLDLTNGGGGADIGDGTTVANIERVDFHGGSASDSIIGGALADTISGNGGNDSLFGIEGNDVLDGGEGDDSLAGGAGSDTVNGGAGHDAIASHNGDAPDLIDGGADSDFLLLERNSYSGSLTLDLTTGGDFADIGDGTSIGNIESIQFQGGSGADHITASSGIFNELIYGNGGNDFLNSGGGNDTMDGGFGDDTLNGGAGDDQLASADGAAADVVDGGADTDLLLLYRDGYNGVLTLDLTNGGGGADIGDGTTVANIERVDFHGGSASDSIIGGALADTISGNGGNDSLFGIEGNDVLDGGEGDDSLAGGAGNDQIDGGSNTDIVQYSGSRADYSATQNFDGSITVVDTRASSPDATDTVFNAELFQFADGLIEVGQLFNQTPIITSNGGGTSAAISMVENSSPVTTVTASDPDAGQSISYSIVGGADSSLFAIDFVTGELSFLIAPDYESPSDLDLNGVYEVIVQASDGSAIDTQTISVSITNQVGVTINGTGGNNTVNATQTVAGQPLPTGEEDLIRGLGGVDNLSGGAGKDTLDGGSGSDTLIGGSGNDTYIVNVGGDTITENSNEGTDEVQASIDYILAAHVENLTLIGGSFDATGNVEANVLIGTSTNNILNGAAGADTLIGGAGNDEYIIDNLGDIVTEDTDAGIDRIQSSFSFSLAALTNVENLTLTTAANIDGEGNELNNILVASGGNNVLDGGGGNDTMKAGFGNDTYVVDSSSDVVGESTNAGTDTVMASVTSTLANNVETLILTGNAPIGGSGNSSNNALFGNNFSNALNGGAGIDTMFGGEGNDSYEVDNASDVVTENLNQGIDSVASSVNYTLTQNVENLTLTTGANINATGNVLANNLVGNNGNNILDGGAGSDTIIGLFGNDTYIVDDVGDVISEGTGNGNDTVRSSVTFSVANVLGGFESFILVGSANINAEGAMNAQTLVGNIGHNTLIGGGGADTLSGGGGADTFDYNMVSETGTTSGSRDKILDFSSAQDRIDLTDIDANTTLEADQAFSFIGSASFTNVAGQLRAFQTGGNTLIEGDVTGDGVRDFQIQLSNIASVAPGDFIF